MTERQIFTQAVEITEPARREEFLSKACGADHALRARVDELLAAHLAANSRFLETPVVDQLQESTDPGTEKTVALPPKKGGEEDDEELPGQPDLSFLQPSTKPGSIGTLGHYEILSILGHGAFGIVFKAFDEKLHRHVAIKMMGAQIAATSPARKRFLREARAAAAIRHDNVTQVYSVEEEPVPYLVMEFIDGQTLQSKQRKQGPLEIPELLHIGRQIAAGLAAAHEKSLIHRDVKPGNILLEQGVEQKVKITDFGLARAADDASLTRSGMISGTPLYMAPEQALGGALDGRSDLFSLGSVLYELATGRPPFRAPSTVAVLRRVVDDTPRPMREIIPELPEWFVTIVTKLLEKQPEKRYQSAKEVAELFARCQSELQLSGQVTCVPGAGSVSVRSTTPGTSMTPALAEDSGDSRPPLSVKPSYKSLLLSLLLGLLVVSPILFGKKISNFISPLIWGEIPTLPMIERAAGLRFDGMDDFIQVPVQWDTPVFTIEAFVTSEEGVPSGTLLHLSNEKRAGIESIELFDEQNQANQPQSFAGVVGGRSQGYLAARLQRGARQHRVLTFDGDHLHYYVNGMWQAKRHVLPEDQLIWKLRQLTIGCKQDRTNFFAGVIDQLRISKVVRYKNNFAPITSVTSDDSTLALYDFDEGTGDVLRDSSGNGADGKILGATWVHPAKGLQFDGVDDYIDFENLGWSSNQYTFETWITPLAEHGTLFQIAVPEGNVHAYLYEGGSGSGLNRDKSYSNVNGPRAGMKRQHLATVFDGKNLSYFIDGTLAGSKSNVSDLTTPWPFQRLRIGGKLDPNSSKPEFFHGRMEQFRVSKSALYVLPFTPEETLQPTADTIALYNFDENQGDVLKDATGHGHDGKIVGATWVRAVPSLPDSEFATPPTLDDVDFAAERRAAEWVLAKGGKVQIAPGGDVDSLDKLPTHQFTLRLISFDGLKLQGEDELKSLARLSSLQHAYLGKSPITGIGMGYVTTCPNLITLALDSTSVRDSDLDGLTHLTKLENLSLHNTRTTDVAVDQIAKCRRLTQLDLSLTSITESGVKMIAARLPECRIRWNAGVVEPSHIHDALRPSPAIAPFTAEQAKQYQTAWAKHLDIPAEFTDKHGMKFVLIPPGEFQMGFSQTELDTLTRELKQAGANEFDLFSASTSGPQHLVRITQPIYMSAHEVTIAQYRSFLEETKYLPTADQFGGKMKWTNFVPKENPDSYPVDGVSWTDADSYCTLRSQRDGVTYRLPSEAEWEFACRAGTTTLWSFGDNPGQLGEYAATASAGVTQLQPVGSRKPNALGLFDMYGNAEEWCRDWHVRDYYAQGPVDDPVYLETPSDTNSGRVTRGGSLSSAVWMTRSSLRRWDYPSTPVSPKGFRVVISGDLKTARGALATKDLDHSAAEWVLSIGGTVTVDDGQQRQISAIHDLPSGSWKLHGINLYGKPLTPADLKKLNGLTSLRSIDLGDSNLEDACVKEIAGLTSLRWLAVPGSQMTDSGLRELTGLTNIEQVAFGRTKITDEGLVHIKAWKQLTSLGLNDTQVSDAGITHIRDCKSLESLNLSNTLVSDVGLVPLTDCPKLETLKVNNTKVTEAGVKKLSTALTGCKIEWDGGVIEPVIGWHGWPADAPPPAIAPFNAEQARQHQEAWAKYLNVPVVYTNSIGMKFMLIPPGEFMMGSTPEEIEAALKDVDSNDKHWQECINSEAPQHKVILTQPTYVGVNEVTQGEYEAVMGVNPSHFAKTGPGNAIVTGLETANFPVENVSWNDAAEFCSRLCQIENLEPAYFRSGDAVTPLDGNGYRLPSEAEWEFACRAGTTTRFWCGDNEADLIRVGWITTNSGGRPHAVGELKANPFGLVDMHGNLWERVGDCWVPGFYEQFRRSAAIDPAAACPPQSNPHRVIRGGRFIANSASLCRSSDRFAAVERHFREDIGFRVSLPMAAAKIALARRERTGRDDRDPGQPR